MLSPDEVLELVFPEQGARVENTRKRILPEVAKAAIRRQENEFKRFKELLADSPPPSAEHVLRIKRINAESKFRPIYNKYIWSKNAPPDVDVSVYFTKLKKIIEDATKQFENEDYAAVIETLKGV